MKGSSEFAIHTYNLKSIVLQVNLLNNKIRIKITTLDPYWGSTKDTVSTA